MDFSSMFQVAPVQLPDPMQQAMRGMSLAQLVRQNRMGQEEDQFKQLNRQADMLATQAYTKARQTGDPQSVLSELAQQGEAGALASQKVYKFLQDQAKAEQDVAASRAKTDKDIADAEGTRSTAKVKSLEAFSQLGTAIASGQAPVNGTTQSAMFEIARTLLPESVWRTMPAEPQAFREWAAVVANPENVSKIALNSAQAGKAQADTAKTNLETQQLPEELKIKQRNAQSQATSAGAAWQNAQTGRERLGLDRDNADAGRWVNDIQGGVQINMKTGETRPITANGQPVGAKKDEAKAKGEQQQVDMADRVLSVVNEMIPKVGVFNTGMIGAGTRVIPGTGSYDFNAQADTIKANLGFEQLQALRAASPTGGALGAVSDSENRMLQAAVASLDTSQSPAQFKANLEKVKTHLERVKSLISQGRQSSPSAPTSGGWGKASVVQ